MTGFGTTLTVRRQHRNTDGDLVGDGADTTYSGWQIAPTGSTETVGDSRDTVIDRVQAYGGPAEVDIRPGDRVYLDGEPCTAPPRWHVVGTPDAWGPPEGGSLLDGGGGLHVVTLQRTTG